MSKENKNFVVALSTLTAVLLVTCLWLCYTLIDTAVSFTYLKASVDTDDRQLGLAKKVIELQSLGQSEDALYEKFNTIA